MKKTACMFLMALIVLFSSCSSLPFAAKPDHYTSMEEISQLPAASGIVGISPDGKYVFCVTDTEIGAYPLDAQPNASNSSTEAAMSVNIDRSIVIPAKKRLQWSKDGKSFIFSDVDYASQELMTMASANVSLFTIKNNSLECRAITNEDTKTSFLQGGSLLYAPSFSYDGGAIVYSAISADSGVYKVDLSTGKKQTIYSMEGRRDIDCLELGNGFSICCINGRKADEGCKLFFVDSKGGVTYIQNEELGLENGLNLFDVKAWSEDRKTLLLTRRNNKKVQGAFDAFFVMTVGSRPDDYKIKAFPMEEGMYVYNAMLSPDGSFIVSCETKDAVATKDSPRMKQLVLCDIAAGTKTPIYSSDGMFGFSSPLNGGDESIYITKNGKLFVWFSDGYRLFQLK